MNWLNVAFFAAVFYVLPYRLAIRPMWRHHKAMRVWHKAHDLYVIDSCLPRKNAAALWERNRQDQLQ